MTPVRNFKDREGSGKSLVTYSAVVGLSAIVEWAPEDSRLVKNQQTKGCKRITKTSRNDKTSVKI